MRNTRKRTWDQPDLFSALESPEQTNQTKPGKIQIVSEMELAKPSPEIASPPTPSTKDVRSPESSPQSDAISQETLAQEAGTLKDSPEPAGGQTDEAPGEREEVDSAVERGANAQGPSAQSESVLPATLETAAAAPSGEAGTEHKAQQQASAPSKSRRARSIVRIKLTDLVEHPKVEVTLRELGIFGIWDRLWKEQTRRRPLLAEEGERALIDACRFRAVKSGDKYLCFSETWVLRHLKVLKLKPKVTVQVALDSKMDLAELQTIAIAEYVLRPLYCRFPAERSWGRELLKELLPPPCKTVFKNLNLGLFSQWTGYSKSSMSTRKKR